MNQPYRVGFSCTLPRGIGGTDVGCIWSTAFGTQGTGLGNNDNVIAVGYSTTLTILPKPAPGPYDFAILAGRGVSHACSNYSVTLNGAATLSLSDIVGGGTVGQPYDVTIGVTGAQVSSGLQLKAMGALPPGLQLETDGRLHGTPTVAGMTMFTVEASDGNSPPDVGQQQYSFIVSPAVSAPIPPTPTPVPTITISDIVAGPVQGQDLNVQLHASGTPNCCTFQKATGPVPTPWLTVGATGLVSGKPPNQGDVPFTVIASDTGAGLQATKTYFMTVGPAPIVSAPTVSPTIFRVTIPNTRALYSIDAFIPTGSIGDVVGSLTTEDTAGLAYDHGNKFVRIFPATCSLTGALGIRITVFNLPYTSTTNMLTFGPTPPFAITMVGSPADRIPFNYDPIGPVDISFAQNGLTAYDPKVNKPTRWYGVCVKELKSPHLD